MSQKKTLTYISKCFHEHYVTDNIQFEIHNGLVANISSRSQKEILMAIPEGRNNTAAENFHCFVYNVSIIDCSWTVGKDAPKDTQYNLAFRETLYERQTSNQKQKRVYVPCEDYRTDSFGRQVGCILKSQKISFNVSVYAQLVGSSNETSIQFFDKIFKLDNYVILDPPRNVQLNYNSDELEITWDPPETYSKKSKNCFIYNVNINGDIKESIRDYSYRTSNLHINEKVIVSVRAKWEDLCSRIGNWSSWSDPRIIESGSFRFKPFHLLFILGIITFAILVLLIFLCHRFQIWKRLFPQIPTPAKKIFETFEQRELLFQEQNFRETSVPEEDEECICVQEREIPQKEQHQHQYVNTRIDQEPKTLC
ncbi:granulocyte-macrophage colony-stimulating factor receptor subunit alpha-like isoform X2 [Pyxicephalus adspersus]|uniref:granulocyte-macrophage colony-stimulating factor receptor subunit alpha-like isoform X2 n=1 Tax=Pyxicephalus adspersus TaxID=30357 RepID=UPI003B5A4849